MISNFFQFGSDVGSGPAPTSAPTQPPSSGGNPPDHCGRAPTDPDNRIVGGKESAVNGNPWQVSLQKPSGSSYYHFCGGSIISETYILTAAHCVENQNTGTWRIVIGAHYIKSSSETGRQVLSVKRAVMHSAYNPSTFVNDIALLELSSKITFNSRAEAVCISKTAITAGENVRVSGWGTISSGGSSPSELRQVTVPIVADSTCERSDYYGNEFDRTTMVCAGLENGGKDSCQGDSGGPLVDERSTGKWYLEGVVSWGYGCAGPKKPGVYARVSNYHSWIVTQTGIGFA